ncbi:hypothetical protein [Streptomyces sp. NPDC006309]|uniref:hypothetical protein n=1 Tax=Streptomyces sp. NPDC006309 TaxID=3156749 RepID=UPI0033AEE38E
MPDDLVRALEVRLTPYRVRLWWDGLRPAGRYGVLGAGPGRLDASAPATPPLPTPF